MRTVTSDMSKKLSSAIQTRANGCAPVSNIWISRPNTVLITDDFLERQDVLSAPVTDTAIAVCHPKIKSESTRIYIAYVSNGIAKVRSALFQSKMSAHFWEDESFSENASAVSIAFDGTMPKNAAGDVEFVTELMPWVFWVNNGSMSARKLGDQSTVVLAEANCTDVSAIRAMWSNVGGFDFGLVVFFIISGVLHYRQYINGEWTDAEVVSASPAGYTWTEVTAFRTWDYRVGVQLKASDGSVYEVFTQFMGIGKQNVEHLGIKDVQASGEITKVTYHDSSLVENLSVASIQVTAPYGGLYSINPSVLLSAANEDDGTGDWGKRITTAFDIHLNPTSISENLSAFTIVDTNGAVYVPSLATVGEDCKHVAFEFTDFNAAFGVCRFVYTPGTATSMAGTALVSTEISFTPTNLKPPLVDPPEIVSAINQNADGTAMILRFSEAITGDLSGNESKFSVTDQEYDYVPGGALSAKAKTVTGVKEFTTVDENIDLSQGTFSGISYSSGHISLEVL